jgi:hypothetical protein
MNYIDLALLRCSQPALALFPLSTAIAFPAMLAFSKVFLERLFGLRSGICLQEPIYLC